MPISLGVSITPNVADLPELRRAVIRADELGLDLVGIQDHPYQVRFLETWSLLADLLARTENIRFFPDVANLALRLPAMIAKQGASLDVLSGGRFELGLGAGAFWEGIAAMGGPERTPRESVEALEEAISIIRLFWSGEQEIEFDGDYYHVRGLHPGPRPAHAIGIWVGAYKPRMLGLVGRVADGWVPSLPYAAPEQIPAMRRRIDEAAEAAGRDPAEIRQIYNVVGTIEDGPVRGLLQGPSEHWAEQLNEFVGLGFDTFVFWPEEDLVGQIERFAGEVAPALGAG
jgi:alkanesulfonate monooxygenase SsuD/methylene tetrahydromethanopterin reductase-like flavin-dependent oxidoreductase (luciferase family)